MKTLNIYWSLSAIILRDEKLALCGLCPTYQFGVTGSSPCTSHRPSHVTGDHHILVSRKAAAFTHTGRLTDHLCDRHIAIIFRSAITATFLLWQNLRLLSLTKQLMR